MTTEYTLSLNGEWQLAYTEDFPNEIVAVSDQSREYYPATVPVGAHTALLAAGVIGDPRDGMNSLSARWVEEQHWVYRRTFVTPPALAVGTPVGITFTILEGCADVFVNGNLVGRHENAHRPAYFAVTNHLAAPGEMNTVIVRIEAGLHATRYKPAYPNMGPGQLTNRAWLRKMQHQCGWDSQVRLQNVGILGDVSLEWHPSVVRVETVSVFAVASDDLTRATVHARVRVENSGKEMVSGAVRLRIEETGQDTEVTATFTPGKSETEATLTLDAPRLWFPVGHGEPSRYTATCDISIKGDTESFTRRFGVRKVTFDQTPHPQGGRYFTLTINNQPIFAKGANWIPGDMLYAEMTPERFRAFGQQALDANFNILRIWGGGLYADAGLLDFCDETGLLVWHDFAFACANYPGDVRAFAQEVRLEAAHVVRERAHHPCLVVWCGNNEVEMFDSGNGWTTTGPMHSHYALFHRDLPRIVQRDAPHTFHWISSPFSPDLLDPSDPTAGDQHQWGQGFDQDGWRFRILTDRFADEGGFFGCAPAKSLRQFLAPQDQRVLSPAWHHHDNTFAHSANVRGEIGRAYAVVTLFTGRDPKAMGMDEFAALSGLLQGECYAEMIGNYRRRMYDSAATIFWMFNDSWPTTNSWSIVDYYNRRKPGFYAVRRAFAPVSVIVIEDGDGYAVYGVNDTLAPLSGRLRSGIFSANGTVRRDEPDSGMVTLAPNSRTLLGAIAPPTGAENGVPVAGYAVLSDADGAHVAAHRLWKRRFHEIGLPRDPAISVERSGDIVTLTCDAFVWGCLLDVDGDAALQDNGFDLYPGVPRILTGWHDQQNVSVITAGNRLVAGL